MTVKVIIPYNFTGNDEKSLDFVLRTYQGEKDAHLTLYHAYYPVPEINVRNNPIMDKMARTTSYLRQVLNEKKNELEGVKDKLISEGFPRDNIDCLFTALKDDLATDIIRLIKKEHYDAVVLNRSPGNIINYFSRSISKRVSNSLTTGVSVHIVN